MYRFCQEKLCFVMYTSSQTTILCEFSWAWPFFVGGDHLYTKKLTKVSVPSGWLSFLWQFLSVILFDSFIIRVRKQYVCMRIV